MPSCTHLHCVDKHQSKTEQAATSRSEYSPSLSFVCSTVFACVRCVRRASPAIVIRAEPRGLAPTTGIRAGSCNTTGL